MATPSNTPRLNLKLAADIDAMLREMASATGLKLVTIISHGIRAEYKRWKETKKL
jgi:hypothetical protein